MRGPVTIPKAIGAVVESVQQPSSRPVLGAPSPQPAQPAQTQAQARAQVQAQVQAQPQPLPGHSSPAVQLREPAAFEAMRYEALRRNPGTKEQLGRPPTPDFTPMTAISVTPTASAAVAGTPPPSTLAPVVQVPSSADISLFSEGWENKLAELVDRMGSTGQSAGDSLTVVRLSPEHLGDLEIGVTMKDGEVDVSFAASVAETRVALEQALPKLRELLGQSGLELSNAGVYSSLPSGSERRQGSLTDAVPIPARADDHAQSEDQPPPDGAHPDRDDRGGVDLYV